MMKKQATMISKPSSSYSNDIEIDSSRGTITRHFRSNTELINMVKERPATAKTLKEKPNIDSYLKKKANYKKKRKAEEDMNSSFIWEVINNFDLFIQETRCEIMDIKVKPRKNHSFDSKFSFSFLGRKNAYEAMNVLNRRISMDSFKLIKSVCVDLEANPKTRDHMEDFINIEPSFNSGVNKIYVLCDGHNGALSAQIIAEKLPTLFSENLKLGGGKSMSESEIVHSAINSSFNQMEEHLRELAEEIENSGSTANLLYLSIEGGKRVAYSGNIGDSRTVLVREKESLRLSYDHKGSDKSEQKRVRAQGGVILKNRFYGSLAITRAFADFEYKDDVEGLIYEPHITRTELLDSDRYIIMASDGVWDVITDESLFTSINDFENKKNTAMSIAKFLVSKSLDLGSKDNISCIAIKL